MLHLRKYLWGALLMAPLLVFMLFPGMAGAAGYIPQRFDPDDPGYQASVADQTGLPQAWPITLGNPSITIAIVDSGVNSNPDLVPNLLSTGFDIAGGNPFEDIFGHEPMWLASQARRLTTESVRLVHARTANSCRSRSREPMAYPTSTR